MPPLKRPLIEIADERSENDAKLDSLEREKKSVMEDYRERIGVLEARSNELRAEYCESRWPVTYDYQAGVRRFWDGRTGEILRQETLPSGTQLPLPEPAAAECPQDTAAPTEETFSQLQDGKVWEHDHFGVCRIVGVPDDSVRVETLDPDEGPNGLEISRTDWNESRAYPREVPTLEIGQVWRIGGHTCKLSALDDNAAIADVKANDSGEPTIERFPRLRFCSIDCRMLTTPDLEVGRRYWLEDKRCNVEVKAIVGSESEESILVEYEDERQEQLVRGDFAGASLLVPKGKKGKKSEPEAAE